MGKFKAIKNRCDFYIICILAVLLMINILSGCAVENRQTADGGNNPITEGKINVMNENDMNIKQSNYNKENPNIIENMVYVTGGTFEMGSPETENWRSDDETLHK